MKQRNLAFDVLKGIAIIAVILYHFGLCPNGYLGVDIFLVIAGYFTAKSLWKQADKNPKTASIYVVERVFRLLPLLLLAEIVIIIYGFILMMPDDFENVSQSVIASNFFANNILADITTKDYWAATNEYKPLMHTWYLGILMQFYVIFVITDLLIYKFRGKRITTYITTWSIISIVSLTLYFLDFNSSHKFYLIPFRLFEFGIGCIAFYFYVYNEKTKMGMSKYKEYFVAASFIVINILLFFSLDHIENQIRLLSVVGLSYILVYYLPSSRFINNRIWLNRSLAIIGGASFSLFIWHQIIFALTRYSFTSNLYNLTVIIIITILICILTAVSYNYIESLKFNKKNIYLLVAFFIIVNISAFIIYLRAGIFYDIPELEVKANSVHRGMWAEYCDNGYKFDKEFTDTIKQRWFIIGNSYGRDFINIILESNIKDKVDLSYATDVHNETHIRRMNEADIVFISTYGLNKDLVDDIKSKLNDNTHIVIVGEKNFGVNNGQIFRKRKNPDYLNSTIHMENGFDRRNDNNRQLYKDNFIDLIALVKTTDGNVRVFSDDGRFISQDCKHLTRAGAQFFSKRIEWEQFLKE